MRSFNNQFANLFGLPPSSPFGSQSHMGIAYRQRLTLKLLGNFCPDAVGRGIYVVSRLGETPVGHFGLAVQDYSHSTAPNRRFPDLITHRLIKAALVRGSLPYTVHGWNGRITDQLHCFARGICNPN
jgi:exoribonuclease R